MADAFLLGLNGGKASRGARSAGAIDAGQRTKNVLSHASVKSVTLELQLLPLDDDDKGASSSSAATSVVRVEDLEAFRTAADAQWYDMMDNNCKRVAYRLIGHVLGFPNRYAAFEDFRDAMQTEFVRQQTARVIY